MKMQLSLVLSVLVVSLTLIACEECVGDVCVPVDGYNDGYYYDSLVSGVTYETLDLDGGTRTGVTGEDGDPGLFRYREGEMVTFSLGNTELGQSLGKDRVTPFDIAGVAADAIGGCEVDGELPIDAFRIVHNLAVLLQTLDGDGDPENGIVISTEVAALFDSVNLNLDQAWEDFQTDTDLQGVLTDAEKTLLDRVDALKALYQALELCP